MPSTTPASDPRPVDGPEDPTTAETRAHRVEDTPREATAPTPEAEGSPRSESPATAQGTPLPVGAGRVRPHVVRSVNWVAFIGTGVVLGFVFGGLVHLFGSPAQVGGMAYGFRTSLLFFGAFGAMLGGLLGALAGVAADAALQRRSRR